MSKRDSRRSSLVSVTLLLALSFSLSNAFPFIVSDCGSNVVSTFVGDFAYVGELDNLDRLCPVISVSAQRFLYNASSLSNVSSPVNYAPSDVCVRRVKNVTTLIVLRAFLSRLPSRSDLRGNLTFMIDETTIVFEYARSGLFTLNSPNITVTEGSSGSGDTGANPGIIFLFYQPSATPTITEAIFKKIGPNGALQNASNTFKVVTFSFNHPCIPNAQALRPGVIIVDYSGINLTDAGSYNLSANNYWTVVNIEVLPDTSIIPTSTFSFSSSMTSTNTDSISPSPSMTSPPPVTLTYSMSPSPTDGGDTPTGALLVYILIGVLCFILVVIVIILIIVCVEGIRRYRKKRRGNNRINESSLNTAVPPSGYSSSEAEEAKEEEARPRGNSVSSNKIAQGRLSSTSSAQSPTTQQDYTGVYCSKRHTHIGQLLSDKLRDRCRIVTEEDEIIASLNDSFCNEMFFFAEPQDPTLRAGISRGVPPNCKEKVKWWHFITQDKTPN